MRRLSQPVVATFAFLFAVSSERADAAPSARFAAVPDGPMSNLKPAVVPLGVAGGSTTVVVQLAGDPVAVASANAPAPMTRAEKSAHKANLRAAQVPVESELRTRGGTILGNYQAAYNGVKVRIAREKVSELATIPGVVAVHPVRTYKLNNTHGVPLVGAPAVWGGVPGLRGEGVKIAIIDTGIDYTHADFGGPGLAAAYTAAHAAETSPADPALFGLAAPKVKGGTDLVGDSYNADPASADFQPIPHPDPNPLDCNGHGSHVSGTAAGFGVLANGTTYHGPYDANTVSSNLWTVGPGVAPKADLYAIRVFGCAGSTDVVVDAIDWAVDHDMDVINMSLGSDFGSADDPDAVAAANAARAGVIVVASAGNAGPAPYIIGTPAVGAGVISVAASDPTPSFPGADLAFSTGVTLSAIDANGATFSNGTTLPVVVLKSNPTTISLGCDPAEYTAAGVAGKLVVTRRGTCARVARAVFGQKAGAAAVLMLNSAAGFPPFEGPITGNPDTGEAFNVTIPFLGVPLTAANRAALLAADGASVSLTSATLANPGFLATASFSSGGPRTGDSFLKPEVTAPGVSIFSVAMGTGNQSEALSGTSMASPHTAGVAALVRQAHARWDRTSSWKAAIVNTADPALVANYVTRSNGAGFVQAQLATATQVIAQASDGEPVLNFGFAELASDFRGRARVKLTNFGARAAIFDVGTARSSGSAHTVVLGASRVTVPARGTAELNVDLAVPAATAGDSSAFADVAGLVTFTPVGKSNEGVILRVPYYLVPQAVSNVATRIDDVDNLLRKGTATATTSNRGGTIAGNADWYAWGLADNRDHGLGSADLRAAGVQTFPTDNLLAFAIATTGRWSNAAMNEFDVFVDVDGDGVWDYDVVAMDLGLLTAGAANGTVAVAVLTPDGNGSIDFLADAPTDSSTIVLPVGFGQLCVANHPCLTGKFSYRVQSFGLTNGTTDTIAAKATFDPFAPTITTGMFDTVAPNATATETVAIDRARFAAVPALGFMVVTHDNPSRDEAQLIRISRD